MADNRQQLQDNNIHHALFNNLILSKIFNNLDLENIKNVRLVCKTWSNEATNIFGTKTTLNIFKMLDNPYSTNISQVNSNLVKNIKINFYLRTMPVTTDAMKLTLFLTENHTFVQQLQYDTISEIFTLFKILQMFPFPTLQRIDINFQTFSTLDKTKPIIPTEAVATIETKPNLRHIKIKFQSYDAEELDDLRAQGFDFDVDNGLKSSLQNLINAAPNLNSFNFTFFPFTPDLSKCNNIKKAKLKICQYGPAFDISLFNNTLNQMTPSLQDLHLKMYSFDAERPMLNKTQLSNLNSFPKLEKLTLNEPWEFIQLIEPSRFPKLRSLVMSGFKDALEIYISSFGHVMKTVKSITVTLENNGCFSDYAYSFLLSAKLKPLFPNATEIIYNLRWRDLACGSDIKFAKHLQALLKVCNEQRIEYLNLVASKETHVPGQGYYNGCVAVELKYLYLEDVQSVKSLEWRCEELFISEAYNLTSYAPENNAETLMNILFLTRNMKSVGIRNMFLGIKHKEELWIRISNFVKQNELPIHFSFTAISY